jgi:hypothetical protein
LSNRIIIIRINVGHVAVLLQRAEDRDCLILVDKTQQVSNFNSLPSEGSFRKVLSKTCDEKLPILQAL